MLENYWAYLFYKNIILLIFILFKFITINSILLTFNINIMKHYIEALACWDHNFVELVITETVFWCCGINCYILSILITVLIFIYHVNFIASK